MVLRYCNKSLEEIEGMFAPGGPKPWHTDPGNSKLNALINEAREKNLTVNDVAGRKLSAGQVEVAEKA
ncbi:hypothetical protein H2203_006039 [Taxawa tesnikishii (nom. ined.)]|nr:hypothetical protein H2203_006039 [Dothideales sp. JES 119]